MFMLIPVTHCWLWLFNILNVLELFYVQWKLGLSFLQVKAVPVVADNMLWFCARV